MSIKELKSPVIIEQTGLKLLVFDKNKLKLTIKPSNFSWPWLGDLYKYEKKFFSPSILILILCRMGIFGAAHGWWGGGGAKGPKICHRYPTMMKFGTVIPCLKKIQKIYESRDTHPEFCWHQHFFTGNQQILLY